MKETELRIQKYKAMLPRARERVIAALMIFVFSIAMLTVSTFSWITLSVAPEVTGATTTIAANGNLEIALAQNILLDENDDPVRDEDGNVIAIPPSASAIGDSLLSITQKNLTWGNIVNLSDASYGLENITLRPATLNTSSLLAHPLYSATYGVDGRVKTLISDFEYTQYNPDNKAFTSSPYKGIKAISSVKYVEVDVDQGNAMDLLYSTKLNNASITASNANESFKSLNALNHSYMDAIGGLLSSYADGLLTGVDTDNVSGNETLCDPDDVAGFYDLLVFLDEAVMVPAGNALIDIFDVYQINTYGQNYKNDPRYVTFSSVDDFCNRVNTVLADMNAVRDGIEGIEPVDAGNKLNVSSSTTNTNFYKALNSALADDDTFNALFPFIADITRLRENIEKMEVDGYVTFEDGKTVGSASVTWLEIKPYIDYLVSIDTVKLTADGKTDTINGWLGSLSYSTALSLAGVLSNRESAQPTKGVGVTIVDGLIERIDKVLYSGGKGLNIEKVTLTIKKTSFDKKVEEEFPGMSGAVNLVVGNKFNNGVTYIHSPIATDAVSTTTDSIISQDIENARTASGFTEIVRDYVAQDTYGLSVDFWLRTNAPQSYLTLEGEVVYTYIDVKVTVDGTEYQVYEVDLTYPTEVEGEDGTTTTEDTIMEAQQIYKKDGVWYFRDNNQEVAPEGSTVKIPANAESDANKLQTKEVTGYVGANRIWTEEELETMSEMEYRTTQGMGSCYTFYADPGEIGQILDILKALKVAFVDSNGNLLATASLATEYCFPEYGKYVVPLMLDENAIDTGEDTEEGDDIRAIMSLEQNVPTLITALVYLDGAVVSNDKVLSSSDIQGQLNLQFGNTYEPQPLDDEELMSETLKITAKVTDAQGKANPEFYFTNTDKSFSTTVELSVEGEAPKTITANFLRKITTTQGTRGETITFVQDASDPTKWTATATFTAPGEYILRSVFADGIERKLTNVVDTGNAEAVKVIVHGFSVSDFSGDKGLTHEYMTAADYVTESFSVKISAYDAQNGTLTPGSVKGVFINEDNVAVTINFTETQSGSGHYTGTATFVSDGTYTLENVMVDGLYYSVGSTYTREVRTKLSVAVWLTHDGTLGVDHCGCGITENTEEFREVANGYQFIYDDKSHDFNVKMKVYDSEGKEITGLATRITYTEGASADLRWSAADEGYVGHITVDGVGEYKFVNATVVTSNGEETITNARSASSVISISRDPATFSELHSSSEVIVIGDNPAATMTVSLNNAKSALVYGFFEHADPDGNTTIYLVKGEKLESENASSVSTFYKFTLPKEAGDGYWTLTKVLATNVAYRKENGDVDFFKDDPLAPIFEGNGNAVEITEDMVYSGKTVMEMVEDAAKDHYLVIEDELANKPRTTKVIAKIHTTYSGEYSALYEGNAFMETYVGAIPSLTVKITDFEGDVINGMSDVKLDFTYTAQDGGYTSDYLTNANVGFVINFATADNREFTSNANDLLYAGTYSVKLSYKYNGDSKDLVMPDGWYNIVKVTSVKPSAKITGISPTGSNPTKITWTTDWKGTPTFTATDNKSGSISADKYTATVYAKAKVDNSTRRWGNFDLPSVTITTHNIGNCDKAILTLPTNNDVNSDVIFEYTQNGAKSNALGTVTWVRNFGLLGHYLNAYNGYGTVTIKEITLIKNGVTYTVTLDNPITINNPSSVNQS